MFGYDQPTYTPATGTVFIRTGTNYSAYMNAVTSNTMNLYLMNVTQYNGSSWVAKTAYIYQNSSWIELTGRTYAYRDGTQYASLAFAIDSGYGGANFNTSYLSLSSTNTSSINSYVYSVYKYTLTSYKTLYVNVTAISGSPSIIVGIATDSSDRFWFSTLSAHTANYGVGTHKLDVTNITGDYHVIVGCYGSGVAININEIYLEMA